MRERFFSSDARPVAVPAHVLSVLHRVDKTREELSLIERRAIDVLLSFRDSSSQREQASFLKTLGAILRDKHPPKSVAYRHELALCQKYFAADALSNAVCPLCSLVMPFLASVLLEGVNTPYAVSNAALRVVLRTGISSTACDTAGLLRSPLMRFLDLLDDEAIREVSDCHPEVRHVPDSTELEKLFRKVRTICTLLGETESKIWILDHEHRILVTLKLAHDVCKTCLLQFTGILDLREHACSAQMEPALDASLKIFQDIYRFMLRDQRACSVLESFRGDDCVLTTLTQILKVDGLSQRCIKSCAVAVVSATVLYRGLSYRLDSDEILHIIQEVLLSRLSEYPTLAQLAMIRAIIESSTLRHADKTCLFLNSSSSCRSELEEHRSISSGEKEMKVALIDQLCDICLNNTELSVRFAAMECIVLCLKQVRPGTMSAAFRERILDLVQLRWQEPFPNVPAQMKNAMDALLALDDSELCTKNWECFMVQVLDAHLYSVGMYPPLSRIIKRVGASTILKLKPHIQDDVLTVLKTDTNAAKPISDWLEEFWCCLLAETRSHNSSSASRLPSTFLSQTAMPLAAALLKEENAAVQERVSSYVLPAFQRACHPQQLSAINGLIDHARLLDGSDEHLVQVTVTVLSVAKRVDPGLKISDHPHLQDLIQSAVRNSKPSVRLMALELMLSCRSTTEPLLRADMEFVLSALPIFLYPGLVRGDVNRFLQIMSKFANRLAESRAAALTGGGWWAREMCTVSDTAKLEASRKQYVSSLDVFLTKFTYRIFASTCPGAAQERRRSALEMLDLIVMTLGVESSFKFKESAKMAPLPRNIVQHLVACIADAWRPSRDIALKLTSRMSILGFDSSAQIFARRTIGVVLPYLRSPRLSEAGAAAAICRFVFRQVYPNPALSAYVASMYGSVPDDATRRSREDSTRLETKSPAFCLMESVVGELNKRLCGAQENLQAACVSGLFFGDIRVLRELVEDTDWALVCAKDCDALGSLRRLSGEIIGVLGDCAEIALRGLENVAVSDMNSAELVPADILTHDMDQKVTTSCHLSVKEICLTLGSMTKHISVISGCLRRVSQIRDVQEHDQDTIVVLDVRDMRRIGELLDVILLRVRHNGVVKGAAEGYEEVCREALQSPCKAVQALPEQWALHAITRAVNGEVSALRRSAGVPYHVLGVVRAEVNNGRRRASASPILNRVFEVLLRHLRTVGLSDVNEADSRRDGSEVGKVLTVSSFMDLTAVHCINVLRFLFLDSYIARSVTRFLARCTVISLRGFRSTSWMVRNSSFMLLSAIIRRGVGIPSERMSSGTPSSFEASSETSSSLDGSRRIRGVTAVQFFSKYPELHPFLLSELEQCVRELQMEERGHGTGSSGYNQHTLFPVLYLLSSLCPSVGVDQDQNFTVSPFGPYVYRCLMSRSVYVRRVAASACVPLVRSTIDVAAELNTSLRERLPRRGQLSGRSGMVENGDRYYSQNKLHGELLRIAAIIKGMRDFMTLDQKIDVIETASRQMRRCCWMATDSEENNCFVTRAAMLRVMNRFVRLTISLLPLIDQMSVNKRAQYLESAEMLLNVCFRVSQCCLFSESPVLPEQHRVRARAQALVGASDMYSEATRLGRTVASAVLPVHSNILWSFPVLELLQRNSYEVRGVAAESFFSSAATSVSACELWHACCRVIFQETHYPVLCNVLDSAREFLAGSPSSIASSSLESSGISKRLLSLACESACVDVREAALKMLGQYIGCMLNQADMKGIDVDVGDWLECMRAFASNTQISSSRLAASESLRASSLVQTKLPEFSESASFAHIVLIGLLQDEDVHVRQSASSVADQIAKNAGEVQSLDALPALRLIHENLCWSESYSLHYVETVLDLYDEILFPQGLLHQLFTVQSGSAEGFKSISELPSLLHCRAASQLVTGSCPFVGFDDDCDEEKGKLFRDDSGEITTESIVLMQLTLWAVKAYSSRKRERDVSDRESLEGCCLRWTRLFVECAEQVCANLACANFMDESIAGVFHRQYQMLARIMAMKFLCPTLPCWESCVALLEDVLTVVDNVDALHISIVYIVRKMLKLLISEDPETEDLLDFFFLIM